MAEGAVEQGQGLIILVHGVYARADASRDAPLGIIWVHPSADSATFPDTPVFSCAHSIHVGPVFHWFICSLNY